MSGLWRQRTPSWAKRPPQDEIARDRFLLRTELQAHVGARVAREAASRSSLLEVAIASRARPALLVILEAMPDRVYADFGDVWNAARVTAESGAWRRSAKAEGGRR